MSRAFACLHGRALGRSFCLQGASQSQVERPPETQNQPRAGFGADLKVMGKTLRRMRVPVRGSPMAGFPGQDAELLPGTSS